MKNNTINFKTLKKMVKENSNDADLGGAMRKIYWEVTNDKKYEKGRNL